MIKTLLGSTVAAAMLFCTASTAAEAAPAPTVMSVSAAQREQGEKDAAKIREVASVLSMSEEERAQVKSSLSAEEMNYVNQLSIIGRHLTADEDGFYSVDEAGAISDGADASVTHKYSENLKYQNEHAYDRNWSEMRECLIQSGLFTAGMISAILAAFAGGPAGLIAAGLAVAAIGMWGATRSVIQSCCNKGYCTAR